MSELDLSGESDPTQRMMQQQERARDGANDENVRKPDHDGDMETEEFDLNEALESL